MADAELLASRYRVVRTIGAGGMGVVYLVKDTRRSNRVMALKTLKAAPPESRPHAGGKDSAAENFRAEFRHVHGVMHPNIPEVFDFGSLPPPHNSLFFTTEFIDGRPLDTLQSQWTPEQLHVILVSLCRALAFLHSRGLLHRDIKPENVLARLDESGSFALIKLVDFGLASAPPLPPVNGGEIERQEVSGTIDYLAPELVNGGAATVATDIYALGMLLYRLAAGRLPFDAQDPLALAKLRSTTEAPPPLRFRPDLPVGFSDVISALIRLKPEDRPPSARHVIALLNEREGTDFPYESAESRAAYVRSAAAVTNAKARERLQTQMQALIKGALPKPVVILSPRGLGRTRLMKEFATDLTLADLSARLIWSDADLAATEEIARVWLVPDVVLVSAANLSQRLAARNRDEWWILGAEELSEDLACALGTKETLHLSPLTLLGVRRFVAATFPENSFPEPFAEQLFTRTLGLPAAVQDTLDHLLAAEMLRIGLTGWELLPGSWNVPLHKHVAAHIAREMSRLPEPAQCFVEALACSFSPLPRQVVAEVARIQQRTSDCITEAEAAISRIGWVEQMTDGYALRFAAVAEHVRESLSVGTRRKFHGELGAAWKAAAPESDPRQARERLYHDFNAGAWSIAAEDAARILRVAVDQGEASWARQLVEAGLSNQPPAGLRTAMLDTLAMIEYIEGNLTGAADHFAEMLYNGTAEITTQNLVPYARYGMLEEKIGHTEHAEAILQRCRSALTASEESAAGIVLGTLAWIAFKRGDAEDARRLAEEGLVRVPPKAVDPGVALLLNTLGTLSFYRGDVDAAAIAWKRCLEVNEAIRDRKGIANMYNNLGVLAAQSGDRLRARSLWEKCAEIARDIHDTHRLAGIYNNLGIDALETGAHQQAEEYYLKSLSLFRRMKSPREEVEALSNLGELSYYRADYARAQAYWQEAVKLAASVNDREGQVEPLVYLGKLLATVEQLEQAETVLEEARDLAHELSAKKGEGQAWEGLALLHARRGEHQQAQTALRNADALLAEDLDPLACLHLQLTECSIAADVGDPQKVTQALARARKVADTKWDPFTAARTLIYGLLFAREELDAKERPRVLRQLAVYPDFLWKFHWVMGRTLAAQGAVRKALDEYGRGVAVLKAIASRLSEANRKQYLNSQPIVRFKDEALTLRERLKDVE